MKAIGRLAANSVKVDGVSGATVTSNAVSETAAAGRDEAAIRACAKEFAIEVGEVTGGIHGGNRHGGNAIVEIFVFGRTAAKVATAE